MFADRLLRIVVAGAAALGLATAAAAQTTRAADPLAGLGKSVTMATADSLFLVEDDHGVSSSRTLKVGDEYRDGWRLTAVTPAGAVLAKGRDSRTIPLGSTIQPQAQAAVGADTLAGRAALTNAVAGQRSGLPGQAPAAGQRLQRTTAPADRARIQTAMADGNVQDVYLLGGSAADVAQMLQPNGGPMAEILAAGGQANFVSMDGRAGVQVVADGRNMVLIPPQLGGVEPPPDAVAINPPPIAPTDQVMSDGAGNVMVRRTIPVPGQ